MMNRVAQILAAKKVGLYRAYIGEFATSMEMAGASISLFKLDSELKRLLDAPQTARSSNSFSWGIENIMGITSIEMKGIFAAWAEKMTVNMTKLVRTGQCGGGRRSGSRHVRWFYCN
jgi:hypothetical protein